MDLSAERVLRQLCGIAFMGVRKLFNPDGSLKSVAELDDDTVAGIAGIVYEKLFSQSIAQ